VREERWKYTRWMDAEPLFEELFDLKADPEELTNLASKPEAAGELNRLRQRWSALAENLK
jgi:arylsulfatase A-like enzyme